MPSKLEFFLGIVVFVAVVSALVLVLMPKEQVQKHAFEAVEEGILFYSEEKHPRDFLLEFKDNNEFFIVLESSEKSSVASANALITLQAVLTADRKKVVSLVEEFSAGRLSSCQTNKGLVGVSDEITPQECSELLDSNSAFIIIKQADNSLKTPEVKLEKNKVFLNPKKDSDIQAMSFLVLKAMYADSASKIKQINDYWSRVSGKF